MMLYNKIYNSLVKNGIDLSVAVGDRRYAVRSSSSGVQCLKRCQYIRSNAGGVSCRSQLARCTIGRWRRRRRTFGEHAEQCHPLQYPLCRQFGIFHHRPGDQTPFFRVSFFINMHFIYQFIPSIYSSVILFLEIFLFVNQLCIHISHSYVYYLSHHFFNFDPLIDF